MLYNFSVTNFFQIFTSFHFLLKENNVLFLKPFFVIRRRYIVKRQNFKQQYLEFEK